LVKGGLLPEAEQVKIIQDVLRSAGPTGKVSPEGTGTYGVYTSETMPLYKKALESIPIEERPQFSLLLSGGRPLLGSDLGKLATEDKAREAGKVTDQGVTRVVPNWGNQVVAAAYLAQVDRAIADTKAAGIRPNATVDDHMGIPPLMMGAFKMKNGLRDDPSTDAQAQKIVTGRIGEIADRVHAAGGEFTLSLVGNPKDARRHGVDPFLIGPKIDVLEMQLYRESPGIVKQNLDVAYNELKGRIAELPNMTEIRIALKPRANNHDLTEGELIGQQKEVEAFKARIELLYKDRPPPPKVTTSLWQYGEFYK
jgi:hypothetical protein